MAVIVQLTLNQNTSNQICPDLQTQCISTTNMVGATLMEQWVAGVLPGIYIWLLHNLVEASFDLFS